MSEYIKTGGEITNDIVRVPKDYESQSFAEDKKWVSLSWLKQFIESRSHNIGTVDEPSFAVFIDDLKHALEG